MNRLTVIMAHAEAQHIFDRHLRYWESESTDLLVMCPQDSVVWTNHPVLAIGRKGHHGPESIVRFHQLLDFLRQMRHDWFVIHEYDSLFLPTNDVRAFPVPTDVAIHSNLFNISEQVGFKGHHFLHPPLCFSRKTLERMVAGCYKTPDIEAGFWDRHIGLVCEMWDIPMQGYERLGYSRNTIEPYHIPEAVAARQNGAVCFHGVKSDAVLRAIAV